MISHPAILGGQPAFSTLLPFGKPDMPDYAQMQEAIRTVIESGYLTKGRHLLEFEAAMAEHLGVRHAVGVSSCTTGLMLTYQGLGLSGEAIVPSFTFMATVSALRWAATKPVFVDVNRHTATLDVAAVERAITPATSAVIGVHTFGNPAEIDALEELCRRRGLKLIFDAAHGLGTLYRNQPVGGQGDAHVFSLSPTKLVVAGEGGIVATNDDQLAEHIRIGREYGNPGNYDSKFAGINARLPEVNAILGLHSLRMLERVVARRNEIARCYNACLAGVGGIETLEVAPGNRCSYKDYSIVINSAEFGISRDDLARCLLAENIDTRAYYSPTVHRHTAYQEFADHCHLPNTEELTAGSLSLPLGPHVEEVTAERIGAAIGRIHSHAAAIRNHLGVRIPLEPVAA